MTQVLAEEDACGAGVERYARVLDPWLEPMLARLVELAAVGPGGRVLDLATGTVRGRPPRRTAGRLRRRHRRLARDDCVRTPALASPIRSRSPRRSGSPSTPERSHSSPAASRSLASGGLVRAPRTAIEAAIRASSRSMPPPSSPRATPATRTANARELAHQPVVARNGSGAPSAIRKMLGRDSGDDRARACQIICSVGLKRSSRQWLGATVKK
jgi:hypothetical protein